MDINDTVKMLEDAREDYVDEWFEALKSDDLGQSCENLLRIADIDLWLATKPEASK